MLGKRSLLDARVVAVLPEPLNFDDSVEFVESVEHWNQIGTFEIDWQIL